MLFIYTYLLNCDIPIFIVTSCECFIYENINQSKIVSDMYDVLFIVSRVFHDRRLRDTRILWKHPTALQDVRIRGTYLHVEFT